MKKLLCILMLALAACPGPDEVEEKPVVVRPTPTRQNGAAPAAVYLANVDPTTPRASTSALRSAVVVEGSEQAVEGEFLTFEDITDAVTGETAPGFIAGLLPTWQTSGIVYGILVGGYAPFNGLEFDVECDNRAYMTGASMRYAILLDDGTPTWAQPNNFDDHTAVLCEPGTMEWKFLLPPVGAEQNIWVPGFQDVVGTGIPVDGLDQTLYWAFIVIYKSPSTPDDPPPTYTFHNIKFVQ
jgi:hypothetical protein